MTIQKTKRKQYIYIICHLRRNVTCRLINVSIEKSTQKYLVPSRSKDGGRRREREAVLTCKHATEARPRSSRLISLICLHNCATCTPLPLPRLSLHLPTHIISIHSSPLVYFTVNYRKLRVRTI